MKYGVNPIKTVLDNTLKAWNENHKPALEYGNAGGQNGLKIKNEGNSIAIYCSKPQAIDIINFITGLEYKKEALK